MRFIVYLAAFLYGLSYWYFPSHDPDLGWHLLGGTWILEHNRVPRADFINSFNLTWLDYHWLAQVLMFKIYSWGGYELLRASLGILMALLSVLMVSLMVRLQGPSAKATPILLTYLILISLVGEVSSIRPQMLAILGLLIVLQLLVKTRRTLELPILFALTVLLANIHVYWIFVPFLWGCYRVLPRVRGRTDISALYSWGGLGLLSCAAFISPYGFFSEGDYLQNYALLFDYLFGASELHEYINELKSGLQAGGLPAYLLLLIPIVIGLGLSLRKLLARSGNLLAGLSSYLLALRSIKFVSLVGILGLPILTSAMHGLWQGVTTRHRLFALKMDRYLPACLLLFALCSALRYFPWTNSNITLNQGYMRDSLPLQACSSIPDLKLTPKAGRDHIRVLTHFDYGGWCRFAMYQRNKYADIRVTTDGRTQFVPTDHYQRSFDLYRLWNDWAQTLTQWNPDVILVPKHRALGQFLSRAPGMWTLRYEDEEFAVFVPSSSKLTSASK